MEAAFARLAIEIAAAVADHDPAHEGDEQRHGAADWVEPQERRFAQSQDKTGSIHLAAYPTSEELSTIPEPKRPGCYAAAVEVLIKLRSAKTEGKKSLRWPIAQLKVIGSEESIEALKVALDDVLEAGNVEAGATSLEVGPVSGGDLFEVAAQLAVEETPAPTA